MLIRDYLRNATKYYGTVTTSELHWIKPAVKPLAKLYRDHEAIAFDHVAYRTVRQTMIESGLTRPGVNSRMKKIVRMFK